MFKNRADFRARARVEGCNIVDASHEFRLIADSAPMPMWLSGLDRKRRFVNRAFLDFLGCDFDTALQFDWSTIVHPDDRERLIAAQAAWQSTPQPIALDARFRRCDGEWRWLHATAQPSFGQTGFHNGFIGIIYDRTDARNAELALQEREQLLSAYVNQSAAGFGEVDLAGRFVRVNDRFCEIAGYSRESLLERTMQSITHPDDLPRNVPLFEAAVAYGTPYQHEKRYVRPDGTCVWVNNSVSVIRDASGRPGGVLAVSIDVTDHRRVAGELEQLNRTLESRVADRTAERDGMWRLSHDVLLVLDARLRVVTANPRLAELSGFPAESLRGRTLKSLIHPADWPIAAEAIRTGRREPIRDVEARLVASDGSARVVCWNAAPEGGRAYVSGRDITDEKRRMEELLATQEALRQAQKLEAIGQLTGGVAHDFNNLLSPIIGGLELLRRRQVGGASEQRLIAAALQSADRARVLVQRLLAFARRQPLSLQPVDLGDLLAGLQDLLRSTLGPTVQLEVRIADGLPPVLADANQLEMAILNLAVNARDAMAAGGRLAIAGEPDRERPDFIVLSVSDTGVGMDEQTAARAVEPFFSTKGVGKGTGLGLSMVEGLTAQLGGTLVIASSPGEGTTVRLHLPIAAAAPQTAIAPVPAGLGNSIGRILLVEDEPLVRSITAEILRERGFDVAEAESATEALQRLKADGEGIECVVTDHLMPGMSGLELSRRLAEIRPDLPVLILTGYADPEAFGAQPFLAKPFQTDELVGRIAALAGSG